MTENSQVKLDEHGFELVLGLASNGVPVKLDLGKSHGIIAAAEDSDVMIETAADQICSISSQESKVPVQVIWIGSGAPEKIASLAGVRVVGDFSQVPEELKNFTLEQEARFSLMNAAGSNNLPHYNALAIRDGREIFPMKMLVIEDLNEQIRLHGQFLIDKLCFAARYGRACGMLPYVCTTDAESLPSLLKNEVADRVCFRLPGRRASVLAMMALGAEALGNDEYLFRHVSESCDPVRLRKAD